MTAFDPIHELGQTQIDARAMAMLRHDIGCAIDSVVAGLSLIESEDLREGGREQFERASAAAKTLSALVRALDAAASAETLPSTDLRRFIAHLRRRHSGEARERGLSLRIDAAPGLPDQVRLDPVALVRIADNLVGNALRFAGRGIVRVEVAYAVDGGIRFAVADEGPGVSTELLSRLLARGDVRNRPSGLGLSIVQRLSDQLGGILRLENRPAGGFDAVVSFPPTVILPDAAGAPDLGGIRILLAEDNPTNQMVASQMLRSLRAEVTVCSDGIEALETFERVPVDLVVVDIEMPRMSGLDVIRAIRRRSDARARVPIVALTAYAMREHRERIAAAGANGLISKPVTSVEALGRDLAAYVLLVRTMPAAEETTTATADVTASSRFDLAIYAALADAIGPELMPELLDKVIADLLGARLELAAALDPFDRAPIRAASHILISVAGALGAVRLQGEARILNNAASAGTAADLLTPDVQACLIGIDEAVAFVRMRLAADGGA